MDILVYADWESGREPRMMGTLTVVRAKGRSISSFAYDRGWLQDAQRWVIDPDLQWFAGPQYVPGERGGFGAFLDSSPDRWGRVLMDRREALLAKTEARRPAKLFDEDYLLGVYDEHRMGALRFKTSADGPFLNNDRNHAAPPWTSLRELESASLSLEQDAIRDREALRWINLLIAPGASLGGARPKASVLDEEGALWIAKFPSLKDTINVGGWEMVAYQLAALSGIRMSEARNRKFNSRHDTFLSKRFDRQGAHRIHFASAMTLLGYQDGHEGGSYLELVELILRLGGNPKADLEELFRRMVFSIAIKNTDDHLRNHGFLLTAKGWTLSPAYDLNPVYHGTGLSLNISETDNALDFELALSVAEYFRLKPADAKQIIDLARTTRKQWQPAATALGLPRNEQELMEPAFTEVA